MNNGGHPNAAALVHPPVHLLVREFLLVRESFLAPTRPGILSRAEHHRSRAIHAQRPLHYGRGSDRKSRLMIIAIGVMCLTLSSAARGDDRFGPHWSQTGCKTCHPDIQQNRVAAVDRSDVTASCLRCHDGHRAKAERHPVGRRIESPRVSLPPPDWPAPDGVLSCLTCHDVRSACNHVSGRPATNPAFLRGEARGVAFCGTCHTPDTSHEKRSPHLMLAADGRLDADACIRCHEPGILAASQSHRTGDAMLHTAEANLCLGCHGQHVDYFDPGHLGAVVPDAMVARIRQQPHGLPLADGNTVTCSTCHNPHAAGVFAAHSELAAGAMQPGAPRDAHPLRGYGPNLCGACHAP